jgi:hypothetical protein
LNCIYCWFTIVTDKLQATFKQLEKLRLGRSPFVLMAVIGQELLAATHYTAAVAVLEAALQVRCL